MCGISGTTHGGAAAVRRMNAVMVHRGPDDEGVWADDALGVALGARRLSIIDLAGGHQPLANEDDSIWAAQNGELYNHEELRANLERKGHVFRTDTDTEVLVHLYEEHGDELVHAIDGMFAFAIVDRRRRRLLLARDAFGEKPLFYAASGGHLDFASEVSALRAHRSDLSRLRPEAIDAFFVLGYVPGPGTLFAGIDLLPAGHRLTHDLTAGVTEVGPWWDPRPRSTPPSRLRSRELDADVLGALRTSTARRLRADVPVGVLLSGGLDSTLVTALAIEAASFPVRTYSVGYAAGRVNETTHAAETARVVGTQHHELILGDADIAASVPALFASLDQPHADPALVALHAVAEFARRDVTVALGGEGADELFGGYPRYRWMALAERLDARVPAAVGSALARLVDRDPVPERVRRGRLMLEHGDSITRHLAWVTGGRADERDALYGPALRGVDRQALSRMLVARLVPGAEPVERMMDLDRRLWLVDDVLAKADRASMRVSLELRTPFLTRELADLALALPGHERTADGGKAVLRRLLKEIAPQAAQRPKTAFRVPLAEWLRGPLRSEVRRHASEGPAVSQGLFDPQAMTSLVSDHASGQVDASATLWPFLALSCWLEATPSLHPT